MWLVRQISLNLLHVKQHWQHNAAFLWTSCFHTEYQSSQHFNKFSTHRFVVHSKPIETIFCARCVFVNGHLAVARAQVGTPPQIVTRHHSRLDPNDRPVAETKAADVSNGIGMSGTSRQRLVMLGGRCTPSRSRWRRWPKALCTRRSTFFTTPVFVKLNVRAPFYERRNISSSSYAVAFITSPKDRCRIFASFTKFVSSVGTNE